MKLAYCIQCHKNNNILRETVRLLCKKNDIYMHVDKKANIDEFNEYLNKVTFIKDRIDVKWGQFSQVEATLTMLKEVNKYSYDYIILLSGDCLILKSEEEIKKILSKNKGKEFIGIEKNFSQKELTKRIRYEYNNMYYKKNKKFIEKILIKVQDFFCILKKNKYYEDLPKLYKGAQWFGITSELSNYFIKYIESNPTYKLAFKKSLCSDEMFFQTIVMNSKYSSRVFNIDSEIDDNAMALRYIDWKSGPEYPKILCEEDFDKIKQSNCIIGRKFNENLNINNYRKYFDIV